MEFSDDQLPDRQTIRANRATRSGESDDPFFRWLPISFVFLWCLQLGLAVVFSALSGNAWVTRLGPLIMWLLSALWLVLYFTVFRPHS
jgi:hypothetical protein